MTGAVWALGIVAGALLPLAMTAACSFSFEQGKLVRTSSEERRWLKTWKPLCLAAGVVAVGVFLCEYGVNGADIFKSIRWEIIAALVALAAWSDFKDRIIPNKLLLVALAGGIVVVGANAAADGAGVSALLIDAAVGAVAGGAIFLVSRLITKGGVGYGDIKMYCVIGLLAGFRGLFNILLLAMIVALVASLVALASKRKKLSDRLPLAPFTFVGVVLAVLSGV